MTGEKIGRSITQAGYVLIRVGKDHHLADVRGYAYEHRLVAEKKLGRGLLPGEQIHHLDGIKSNNHPDNLEVIINVSSHARIHGGNPNNQQEGESNYPIECACGCGLFLLKYDERGRPRIYIRGHNSWGNSYRRGKKRAKRR